MISFEEEIKQSTPIYLYETRLIMQIFGRSPCVFSSLHLVFRKAMTHNYPKRNFYFSNAFATPPAQLLLSLLLFQSANSCFGDINTLSLFTKLRSL
ncbi:hypothetical protein T11_9170 [Trichinella zimbabwensis]|uniref:Uncharacterized protein n=1 Tax=Trichinella zimbabwensis TaxID=268475 RepID=A0A0V1GSS6_9BILA|nr:hypothetical protein T11_9170 [Trichinella zimbabwensis]